MKAEEVLMPVFEGVKRDSSYEGRVVFESILFLSPITLVMRIEIKLET